MQNGRIVKALSGFYYVNYEGKIYETRARGLFRKKAESPLVGDFVNFQIENETGGYITELLPRKNALIRPPVSNIDQVLLVMSAKSPDFSYYLLDRFIAYLESFDIDPVIIVTKTDLLNDDSILENIKATYSQMYDVFFTSQSRVNREILNIFPNKLSVLAGQSGVGKSTLLNSLIPNLELNTNDISNALNRGKHTTRHVELVALEDGLIADTPGFSTIDYRHIDKYNIKYCFKEFNDYQMNCKFRECAHLNEPKCAVKDAVSHGEIASSRYNSYKAVYEEISNRKERY